VYELHQNPQRFGIEDLTAASLQLLHVAAHIDAIERRIKPLLASGKTVVLDRFRWSTYVYGLIGGVARDVLEGMIELERRVWEPLKPDRLLHISRESPLRNEPPDLWPRWRTAYQELAHREAEFYPVVTVANDECIHEAQERILTTV
jgi:thymidylate kinase